MKSIDGGTDVILRQWYATGGPREALVSRGLFGADMAYNERWGETVYQWTGTDRDGAPLTVVWIPAPAVGSCVLYAYELPGGQS